MPELQPYRRGISRIRQLASSDTQPDPTLTAGQQSQLSRLGGIAGSLSLPRGSLKRRVIIAATMIWTIGGFLLVGGFLSFMGLGLGPFDFLGRGGFLTCLLMPFVFVGTILIFVGGSWLWDQTIGYRLAEPSLNVTDHSLRPGQTLELTYTQSVRVRSEVQALRFRLLLRETATYTSGTETHTVTHEHVVAEEERMGRHAEPGQIFEERLEFALPPDAMHTFRARHNRLEYFLSVQVRLAGWPDFHEEYEILVEA